MNERERERQIERQRDRDRKKWNRSGLSKQETLNVTFPKMQQLQCDNYPSISVQQNTNDFILLVKPAVVNWYSAMRNHKGAAVCLVQ